MGIHEGKRIWQKGAESKVAREQDRGLSFNDLVERSRTQVERFAKENTNLVTVFIGTGLREKITNAEDKYLAAKHVARTEPGFVPDTLEELDHRAAFLVALAEELEKPEYNQ